MCRVDFIKEKKYLPQDDLSFFVFRSYDYDMSFLTNEMITQNLLQLVENSVKLTQLLENVV